jgi:hypothetical protein
MKTATLIFLWLSTAALHPPCTLLAHTASSVIIKMAAHMRIKGDSSSISHRRSFSDIELQHSWCAPAVALQRQCGDWAVFLNTEEEVMLQNA